MNRTHLLGYLFLLTAPVLAYASCKDIEIGCAKNHQLDLVACEKNYSGQQKTDCFRRADEQFNRCYNGAGCK